MFQYERRLYHLEVKGVASEGGRTSLLVETPQINFEHIDVVVPGDSVRLDRTGVSANIPVVDTSEVTRVHWALVAFMLRVSCASDRPDARARPLRGTVGFTLRTDFYREEFLKHQACLELQRDAYSECAITEMEAALRRVMAQVDELCAEGRTDVGAVVSRLLQSFDGVTKLSTWSDPSSIH